MVTKEKGSTCLSTNKAADIWLNSLGGSTDFAQEQAEKLDFPESPHLVSVGQLGVSEESLLLG